MKNPKTPTLSRQNQRKYSLTSFLSCHEAKVPVKTMMAESSSIATEIPSTPTAKWMLSGAYHMWLAVKSMAAVSPASRRARNRKRSTTASSSSKEEPATITAWICRVERETQSPSIINSGMRGNRNKIFIVPSN